MRDASSAGDVTVTLGRLYLQQGHREDAALIFEQLLQQDPDNAEARRGLALARRGDASSETPDASFDAI